MNGAAGNVFDFIKGDSPLVLSIPHDGGQVPDNISNRFTEHAKKIPDRDWHVKRLYDFATDMDATVIAANYARYVIDLNRSTDGAALYPGKSETSLCPLQTFHDGDIYRAGEAPIEAEIRSRVETYWRPYHLALQENLARVKEKHGFALLWDAHSIRSHVPKFFDGALPDLNFGTVSGKSCASSITDAILQYAVTTDYSVIANGRFKGGYITRHYGDPANKIFAIQLELSQATYMNEDPPFDYDEERAAGIKPVLRQLVEKFMETAP